MATFITYQGVTWTFSTDRPTGVFANGEPWVQGPVTVTAISPTTAIINTDALTGYVVNGSMKNPVPELAIGFSNGLQLHGLGPIATYYSAVLNEGLNLPLSLVTGDILVTAVGDEDFNIYGGGPAEFLNAFPRWDIMVQRYCALTVVTSDATGKFRPGLFGTTRGDWSVDDIDWSIFPNKPAVVSSPSLGEIQALVPSLPWLEWSGSSSTGPFLGAENTATGVYDNGQTTYGRDIADKWSDVALYLMQQPTVENQTAWENLVIQTIQVGIDMHSYFANGGVLWANGAQKVGRSFPHLLAAVALGDAGMLAAAGSSPVTFPEKSQTIFSVGPADVGRVMNTADGNARETYLTADLGKPEWGNVHWADPANDDSRLNAAYRTANWPQMAGAILAIRLMGKESEYGWAPTFFYTKRFNDEISAYTGFVGEMWGTHYAALPPLIPVLMPGPTPNWTATAVPAQQGNPAHLGYTNTPTAMWAGVVNFSRLDSAMEIGVAAAHICGPENGDDGIKSVTFICNNGAPVVVTEPTLNPRTDKFEYWVSLAPYTVDGMLEVRAIVEPHSGLSRVLQGGYVTELTINTFLPPLDGSLLLWSNANGTRDPLHVWVDAVNGDDDTGSGTLLLPWKTLQAAFWATYSLGPIGNGSHVVFNLQPGEYVFHGHNADAYAAQRGWATYQPAAGVTRDQVVLAGHHGADDSWACRQWLVHLKDVSLRRLSTDRTLLISPAASKQVTLWFEGVEHFGEDKWVGGTVESGCNAYYFTNSDTHRGYSHDAREAMRCQVMVNVDFDNISGDGLNNTRYARGITMNHAVANMTDPNPANWDHLDMLQGFSMVSNSMFCDNQLLGWVDTNGFFYDRTKNNLAFINNVFHNQSGAGSGAVAGGQGLIMWHNTFINLLLAVVTDPFNLVGDGGGMEIATFSVHGNIFGSIYYLEKLRTEGPSAGISVLDQTAYEAQIDGGTAGRFSHNHYIAGSWLEGSNATTATSSWSDADGLIFFPNTLTASVPVCIAWDIHQNTRSATTLHGAMEFAGSEVSVAVISLAPGIYRSGRTVTLSLGTAGALMFYTLDGEAPGVGSTPYAGAFALTASATLRVIATHPDYPDYPGGPVTEATYTVITDGSAIPPRSQGVTLQ